MSGVRERSRLHELSSMSITRHSATLIAAAALSAGSITAETPLSPIHLQRYCMGTMIDMVVYEGSKAEGERAVKAAMAEIVRLDQVMSHFKPDSDLSRLVRDARHRTVAVEPTLYEVIQHSLAASRISGGRFDVTIAPLLKMWRRAYDEGRRPSAAEIVAARQCVGFAKIATRAPNYISFSSDCLELDLGGIGKGYAVDRAMGVLKSAGVQRALINAGGSSIAAIGSPPGKDGWPVSVGPDGAGPTLLLRDASISTSQQTETPHLFGARVPGEIIDPAAAAPAETTASVRVVAPSGTWSDALSTALILMTKEEATRMLARIPDVAAMWMSAEGRLQGTYRESLLRFAQSP